MSFLPNELIDIILKYKFGICNKCNNITNFSNLKHNIRFVEYYSVFSNNYYLHQTKYINRICLNCIDDLYHLSENTYIYY